MVAPKGVVRPAPPAAQVTVLDVGRTEGDVAKVSPDTMVVAERTSGNLSLALTSGDNHSPTQDEPLLWWTSLQDPTSTLFTLDDAAESMERESLDVGIASVLKALDHARGALRDVIVPFGWVFA